MESKSLSLSICIACCLIATALGNQHRINRRQNYGGGGGGYAGPQQGSTGAYQPPTGPQGGYQPPASQGPQGGYQPPSGGYQPPSNGGGYGQQGGGGYDHGGQGGMATRPCEHGYELSAGWEEVVGPVRCTFSCDGKSYGYYADEDNNCKIFHVCHPVEYPDGRQETFWYSFFCNNLTVFDQSKMVCVYEDEAIPCSESKNFYHLNEQIGKAPAASSGSGYGGGQGGYGGGAPQGGYGGGGAPQGGYGGGPAPPSTGYGQMGGHTPSAGGYAGPAQKRNGNGGHRPY